MRSSRSGADQPRQRSRHHQSAEADDPERDANASRWAKPIARSWALPPRDRALLLGAAGGAVIVPAGIRNIFGDDQSTTERPATHYAEGPPPDWPEHFVTAYASVHPWKDFAETSGTISTCSIHWNRGWLRARPMAESRQGNRFGGLLPSAACTRGSSNSATAAEFSCSTWSRFPPARRRTTRRKPLDDRATAGPTPLRQRRSRQLLSEHVFGPPARRRRPTCRSHRLFPSRPGRRNESGRRPGKGSLCWFRISERLLAGIADLAACFRRRSSRRFSFTTAASAEFEADHAGQRRAVGLAVLLRRDDGAELSFACFADFSDTFDVRNVRSGRWPAPRFRKRTTRHSVAGALLEFVPAEKERSCSSAAKFHRRARICGSKPLHRPDRGPARTAHQGVSHRQRRRHR